MLGEGIRVKVRDRERNFAPSPESPSLASLAASLLQKHMRLLKALSHSPLLV